MMLAAHRPLPRTWKESPMHPLSSLVCTVCFKVCHALLVEKDILMACWCATTAPLDRTWLAVFPIFV
eukprot:4317139-Karenia_brevis.AAC.1